MDDTYEDWDKWRHPLQRRLAHPWVPDFPVPMDLHATDPATESMFYRHSCESRNYLLLMNSLSHPKFTLELQDLSPKRVFSLEELHLFCGKDAAMYALADLRTKPGMEARQRGLCGRLYGEWFDLVESNSEFEVRFFALFMQTEGLDVEEIIKRHRVLSQQVEKQMKEPIERVVEGEEFHQRDERKHHADCTLLSSFKDLVIIVDEQSFRADALLIVLNPVLAEGIPGMEQAKEDEMSGQKVVWVRMKMEVIMRAVIAMQKKAAVGNVGVLGQFTE